MSMAIRSPRQSAMGVRWTEDFRRGRDGVRRNQGDIAEVAPDYIGFEGKWVRFTEGNSRILYPRLNLLGVAAITFGARFEKFVSTGTNQYAFCQGNAAAWPTGVGFIMVFSPHTTRIDCGVQIAGAYKNAAVTTWTEWTDEFSVVCTWESGDYVRLYGNGEQIKESNLTAGVLVDAGNNVSIGGDDNLSNDAEGSVADPFVDLGRAWTADEILAWHNRSLFV